MTCANEKRQPGYYVLQRVYVPSGEYHLEPFWIKDTSTRHECECPKCKEAK